MRNSSRLASFLGHPITPLTLVYRCVVISRLGISGAASATTTAVPVPPLMPGPIKPPVRTHMHRTCHAQKRGKEERYIIILSPVHHPFRILQPQMDFFRPRSLCLVSVSCGNMMCVVSAGVSAFLFPLSTLIFLLPCLSPSTSHNLAAVSLSSRLLQRPS